MRFTSAAVSATVFGLAMALPGVVYETSVVTVTSCSPEKTNCPGKTSTNLPVYTPPPPPSTYTTPCPSSGYVTYSHGPNVTYVHPTASSKPNCPGYPNCPPTYTSTPVCPGAPHCPSTTSTKAPVYSTSYPYVPSGTGYPVPPKNTSSPVVPTQPPTYPGAASVQSFSLFAVGAAVAAFFL